MSGLIATYLGLKRIASYLMNSQIFDEDSSQRKAICRVIQVILIYYTVHCDSYFMLYIYET